MEKEYDVFSVGNALVDLIINSDETHLKELGVHKGGLIFLNESKAKKIISSVLEQKPVIVPGGSSANVISMLANLGSKSYYSGKVGNDFLGEEFENVLKKEGIMTNIVKENTHTGTAVTFITPDKERSFAVYLGASVKIKDTDIDKEIIKKSRIIHIEGYQFYDKKLREMILSLAKIAKDSNTVISLDLSSYDLVKENRKAITNFIKEYVNILFANEEESFAFTELENPNDSVEKISEMVDIAIVKLGENGSLIKAKGEFFKINAVKAEVIDTNGAGDAYAAGFLYSYVNNRTLSECGNLASYVASKVVANTGARLDFSIRKEVLKIKL